MTLAIPSEPGTLNTIKAQIDLILLSLEALAAVGSSEILAAAEALGFEAYISDRVGLWRLRQSSPLRRSRGGRRKLDVDEARALALICTRLAQNHQSLIREAIDQWQILAEQGRQPHQHPLLGDYLDSFTSLYQERMNAAPLPAAEVTTLALDLLIDLLFYSNSQGYRRLWLTLLERTVPPEPLPLNAWNGMNQGTDDRLQNTLPGL